MSRHIVKRGEIYLYNFGASCDGSIQNGLRPVLVIQCNEGNNASPTTVIAAITTAAKKQYLPTHILLGPNFGLDEPSMAMLEQLKTVNQKDLTKYIGIVDNSLILKKIDTGLKKSMGLWKSKPINENNVRCLCRKCLQDYIDSGSYIIKRLDPFSSEKSTCDKCENFGYDYIVYEKSRIN